MDGPDDIASPCIGLCRLEPASGHCEGCGRTLDEIAAWSRLAPSARAMVRALLPARLEAGAQRRRLAASSRRMAPRKP